jgi:hypothetical protein
MLHPANSVPRTLYSMTAVLPKTGLLGSLIGADRQGPRDVDRGTVVNASQDAAASTAKSGANPVLSRNCDPCLG